MKTQRIFFLGIGALLITLFAVWTVLIQIVDVQSIGPGGTEIGFAAFNGWFHQMTGVHMPIYIITDWLGLVPVAVCLMFGAIGFVQMAARKYLMRVDPDLILLGIYYVLVLLVYLLFDRIPINYRPILIDGRLEVSYPSSTTLLVLSVMPTLIFQAERRMKNRRLFNVIHVLTIVFCCFMVIGRLISGVHWFTDIIGSVLLSAGLFCMYQAAVI